MVKIKSLSLISMMFSDLDRNRTNAPLCSVENFVKNGFFLFKQSDFKKEVKQEHLKEYLESIHSLKSRVKEFLELDRDIKQKFHSETRDFIFQENGYFPGLWSVSAYDDRDEKVDFCLEYLISNNFYDPTQAEMFLHPDFADRDRVETYKHLLPNQEARQVCDFLDRYVLSRIRQELTTKLTLDLPLNCLQIQVAYYPEQASLSKHTDSSFLQANIGPTENLTIYPLQSSEPITISLEVGEVILYTGRDFKKKLNFAKDKLPNPLPHQVQAKKGRTSILAACFAKEDNVF